MEQISISRAKALKKIDRTLLHFSGAPHAPNKKESECLRRIMAETGLTDEEIRVHKTYRKQLAEASKSRGSLNSTERYLLNFMKRITQQTKLPIEHPDTKAAFLEAWKKLQASRSFWSSSIMGLTSGQAFARIVYLKKWIRENKNG